MVRGGTHLSSSSRGDGRGGDGGGVAGSRSRVSLPLELVLGVQLHLGLIVVLEVHGHTRGLDGNATLSLIRAVVGEARGAGLACGDNASLLDEGVRQRGLAVVHVRNHGHVTDVRVVVHDGTAGGEGGERARAVGSRRTPPLAGPKSVHARENMGAPSARAERQQPAIERLSKSPEKRPRRAPARSEGRGAAAQPGWCAAGDATARPPSPPRRRGRVLTASGPP